MKQSATKPLLLMGAALTGLYLLTRSAKGAEARSVMTLMPGKRYFLRIDIAPPLSPTQLAAVDVLTTLTNVLPVWTATAMVTMKTSTHLMVEVSPMSPSAVEVGASQEVILPDGAHRFTLSGVTQG